jgi:hypothetical protein
MSACTTSVPPGLDTVAARWLDITNTTVLAFVGMAN